MHCALSGRERSRGETEAARNQLDLQLLHLSRDCVPPNIIDIKMNEFTIQPAIACVSFGHCA